MYEDFDDLRDNCPAEVKATIAIDFEHDDAERLKKIWPATEDGEFRLYLTTAVSEFWESEVRKRGGDNVPDDCFAIEIVIDSFSDPEMGSTLYLALRAFCGTKGVGDLAWKVFDDDKLERVFSEAMDVKVPALLKETSGAEDVRCVVEVTEVDEV
ncbi:MAG: hypothetical protein ACI9UK_000885 [Candidatus Krumholzibacteriia bacterium]